MKRMDPKTALKSLGVQAGGHLSPCPDMPNCVCSYGAESGRHFITPIKVGHHQVHQVMSVVKSICSSWPRGHIAAQTTNYLHLVVTTPLMKLSDDVEFFIDSEQGLLHLRSASRLGHWDLGVNRRRMNQMVSVIQQKLSNINQ